MVVVMHLMTRRQELFMTLALGTHSDKNGLTGDHPPLQSATSGDMLDKYLRPHTLQDGYVQVSYDQFRHLDPPLMLPSN